MGWLWCFCLERSWRNFIHFCAFCAIFMNRGINCECSTLDLAQPLSFVDFLHIYIFSLSKTHDYAGSSSKYVDSLLEVYLQKGKDVNNPSFVQSYRVSQKHYTLLSASTKQRPLAERQIVPLLKSCSFPLLPEHCHAYRPAKAPTTAATIPIPPKTQSTFPAAPVDSTKDAEAEVDPDADTLAL